MFGFSLMPNHFHFVIEASHQQSLSRFMQWLLTSHVRRYHKHYGGSGQVWQGRFKSFPVQRDEHLLMVQRDVLQNPVRSGLATSVNDWPWSSWCRSDATKPASTSSGLRDESLEESDNQRTDVSLMKSQPRDSLPRGTAPSHGPWLHLGVGATITTTLRKFRHLRSRYLYCCLRTPAGNKSEQPAV